MVGLGEVFRQHGTAYRQKYDRRMPSSHLQAMRAIERCRTAALGGHVYQCPDCGEVQYRYHSCRNRHCPQCQQGAAQQWLEKPKDLLLPTPYFMLTFYPARGFTSGCAQSPEAILQSAFSGFSSGYTETGPRPAFHGGAGGHGGCLAHLGKNADLSPPCAFPDEAGDSVSGACWRGRQRWQLVTCQERFPPAGQSAGQDLSGQVPSGIAKVTLL